MDMSNVLWVDGRSETAYQQAHFPGAIHLSLDDWDNGLTRLLESWDGGMQIVVYCDGNGCESSRAIAQRLRDELGEGAAYWLVDGWAVLEKEVPGL